MLFRDIVQDVRYSWRQLCLRPSFTTVAVLTLGLGIAAQTSFFTVVNAFLFKPVPVARLENVGAVSLHDPNGRSSFEPSLTSLARAEANPPASVAAVGGSTRVDGAMVQIPGRAQHLTVEGATAGYARVLDLPAQVGRWFTPDDEAGESSEPVAVVSDAMWRDWFAGDRAAIGTAFVRVTGARFRVVGVAPPRYRGLMGVFVGTDVWIPLSQVARLDENKKRIADFVGAFVIMRARPGASWETVAGELGGVLEPSTIYVGPAANVIAQPSGITQARVVPVADRMRAYRIEGVMTALVGVGTLILLAACANVANMLYARATERAGETSLRLALGATRGRILRQSLVEASVLSSISAAVGLTLALAGSYLLTTFIPTFELNSYMHLTLDLSPDLRVLMTAFAAGFGAAVLIGCLTAWHSSRAVPLGVIAASNLTQGATRRGGTTRAVLVSVQVTIALLLAMTTGLFWEQFSKDLRRQRVYGYSVHYDAASVVTGRVDVRLHGYQEAGGRHFFDQAQRAVAAIPGVDQVALADSVPGARQSGPRLTMFEQYSAAPISGNALRLPSHYIRVSPGFLSTIGLRLQAGRDFGPSDGEGAPAVAIVSRSFADKLWPGRDALGQQLNFAGNMTAVTVVGIADDPVSSAESGPLAPAHFALLPLAQHYEPSLLIVARSATPAATYEPIRRALRGINDDVAISGLGTVRDSSLAWLAPIRALMILMTSVGTVALGISMLGVYGVVSYFVSLRTREIAIRLALGARPRQVLELVFGYTRKVVLIGLLPGVWIAASGSRWIESGRLDIMPNDIGTWVLVPLLVLAAGLVAGYVPARRASKVDPNVALRSL
jgi:putative ABC transport system permease protein